MIMVKEGQHRQPSTLFVKIAERCIAELSSSVTGINSVLLATSDGFEMALVTNQANLDGGKISAVSSSILSMIQSFTAEIKLVNCQSLILDAQNGKAIIAGVPCKQVPLVLVVLTTEQVLLGQALHGMRHCIQRLVDSELKLLQAG
jgi:predicted regulator of Ras-like GTPase activity (Roadblock/LC7/MglB family)